MYAYKTYTHTFQTFDKGNILTIGSNAGKITETYTLIYTYASFFTYIYTSLYYITFFFLLPVRSIQGSIYVAACCTH